MSWTNAVMFEPDERLIREFPLGAKMSLDSGLVAVTNHRVLVIQHVGKVIRSYHLAVQAHLESIQGIAVDGIANKKLTITTSDSPTGKIWFYMGKEVELFQQIVGYQRQLRLQSLHYQKSQQEIQRQTFTIVQKVEKAPLLTCLWCKQLIPEGAVKCVNCGGPASAKS